MTEEIIILDVNYEIHPGVADPSTLITGGARDTKTQLRQKSKILPLLIYQPYMKIL